MSLRNVVALTLLTLMLPYLAGCGNISGGIRNLLSRGDQAITLSADQTQLNVREGTTVLFSALLSQRRQVPTTVTLSLSGVGGGGPSDIAGLPSSVVIPAGSLSKAVQFDVLSDLRYEGAEVLYLSLSASDDTIKIEHEKIEINIEDLESRPVIRFTAASQNVLENALSPKATVTLSTKSSKPIEVPYTFTSSTATAADYTATNGTLVFAPGEDTKDISFAVINDTDVEAPESVSLALGAVVGDATLGTPSTQTIHIVDDDQPMLTIDDVTIDEGSAAVFTISLSQISASNVTVTWATENVTASAGTHYTASSGTATITAGSTTTTVSVPTQALAAVCDSSRQFRVKLSSAANASIADDEGLATLNDPDLPVLSLANGSGTEGSAVGVTANLSAACPSKIVSFKWSTGVPATASAGTDYTSVNNQTATIPAGQTSVALTTATISDMIDEANETFTVSIANAINATIDAGQSTATATINDNTPTPTAQFAVATSTVSEGTASKTITISLSHASSSTVTVAFSAAGTATGGGTDYSLSASPVSIAAGDTSADITVTLIDDALAESDETVVLSLGTVTNATASGTTTHTLTINDNDLPTFSITGLTGNTDSTQDANLNSTLNPTLNWGTVAGAASFDVTIFATDGTTVVCATQNTTTAVTSFAPVACTLTAGTAYKARVVAKNAGATKTREASNSLFDFFVNRLPTPINDGLFYVLAGGSITLDPRADNPATGPADADTDPDGDSLTITSKTDGAKGTVTINSGTSVTYTPSAGQAGSDSFTYTVGDGRGGSASATVNVRIVFPFTWTGLASSSWSDGDNWCGSLSAPYTSCNGAAGPPSATDLAIFDDTCVGVACNASIDTNASALGINLKSTYSGVLTQLNTFTLTLGATGFSQAGGSFVGGNSAITNAGPFVLSGTSNFTSTSAVFEQHGNLSISGTPTFSASTGTFAFKDAASAALTPGSVTFQHVKVESSAASTWSLTGTLKVAGDFTLNINGAGGISGGVVEVSGNADFQNASSPPATTYKFVGVSAQTITGTSSASVSSVEIASSAAANLVGTLNVEGDFKYTSGTLNAGTSTLVLKGASGTFTPGSPTYNYLKFQSASSVDYLISGTAKVGGNLNFDCGTSCRVRTGTIEASKNVGFDSGLDLSSTATLRLVGSGAQSVSGVAGAGLSSPFIIASSGTVSLTGALEFYGDFTYSSGTVSVSSPNIRFGGASSALTPGAIQFNDVTFKSSGNITYGVTGTLSVTGNLSIDNPGQSVALNTGVIEVKGNLSTTATTSLSGTAQFLLDGTGTQTITGSGTGWTSGNVTVNKSSGSVVLATNVTWNTGTQTLAMTSGLLELNGKNLTLKNLTMAAGTKIFKGCAGVLTVNGSAVGAGAYGSGTIEGGDMTYLSVSDPTQTEGSGNLSFVVSLDRANCGAVTFNYSTSNGTATSGSDYTSTSGTGTITAGNTSTTVTVTVTDDSLSCEGNETLNLAISSPSSSLVADNTGVGTIQDNDDVSLSVDDVSVVPGVSATFTVSTAKTCSSSFTFDYATANNTASAGADYTTASGTATISANAASTTVTVLTASNPSLALNRSFYLNLSNVTQGTIADAQGVGTIAAPTLDLDLTQSLNSQIGAATVSFARSSHGTYFDSNRVLRTADPNVARLDYDPSTGRPLGLLIEDQRTNILTYSQAFENSAWNKGNLTVVANAESAPDGSLTATRLVETSANAVHYLDRFFASQTINVPWSFSAFVKAAERSLVSLTLYQSSTGNYIRIRVDLSNGSIYEFEDFGVAVASVGQVIALPNGWYRILLSGTLNSGTATGSITPSIELHNAAFGDTYSGNTANGLYVWGAQLEQGEVPTSYIATGSTSLTRAADIAAVNSNSWYNTSEGAYQAEVVHDAVGGHQRIFESGKAAGTDWITLNRDTNTHFAYSIGSGGTTRSSDYDMQTWTTPARRSVGLAYKFNDVAAASDGAIRSTSSTLSPLPGAPDAIYLGRQGDSTQFMNGHLTRLRYYDKRLNNASLETVTTLSNLPTLSISDTSVDEDGSLSFTVKLSTAISGSATSVNWTASSGSATLGTDTTGSTSGTATIAAGATSTTISIATVDDTIVESDENLFITLSGLPATVSSGDLVATGTIKDASINLDFASYPLTGGIAVPSGFAFKRASTGTYFDSTGTLKTSPANLLVYSQDFNLTPWGLYKASVRPSAAVSPSGAFDATQFIEVKETQSPTIEYDQSSLTSLADNTDYIFSIYAKSNGRNINIDARNRSNGWASLQVNLSTGTTNACTASNFTAECYVTNVGNGWYRLSMRFNTKGPAGVNARIIVGSISGATAPYAGDGSSGLFLWGAQLELAAGSPYVATNYIPTYGTINYAPRFDYDPATCASGSMPSCPRLARGLMIEQESQNSLRYSEQLDNSTYWTTWQASVTGNSGATTAPDGTYTADLFKENSANDQHDMTQSVSITAGSIVTYTVFAKNPATNGRRYIAIALCGPATGNCARKRFDLSDGSSPITDSTGTPTLYASEATPVGNGWYRLRITGRPDATSTSVRPYLLLANTSTGAYAYAGDNTSGIYLWGAQLEIRPMPSSYIPTVASAATRYADRFSADVKPHWFTSNWTIFTEFARRAYEPTAVSSWPRLWDMTNDAGGAPDKNRVTSVYTASTGKLTTDAWSTTQTGQLNVNMTPVAETYYKFGYSLNGLNGAASLEGSAVTTHSYSSLPTLDRLHVGEDGFSTSDSMLGGWFSKLQYVRRAVPDNSLQTISGN